LFLQLEFVRAPQLKAAVMRFSFSHAGILTRIICVLLVVLCSVIAGSKPNAGSPNRVFDEYGRICWEDEQARLDNFAARLESWPQQIGNIVVYDGRRACRGEAIARAIRAKQYIVGRRRIDPNRVLWRFGGYKEEFTVILMDVPRGYPEWPTDPTVSPRDVVFVGNCYRRVRPSRCLR
jgi:hypothetical protein